MSLLIAYIALGVVAIAGLILLPGLPYYMALLAASAVLKDKRK